MAFYSRPSSSAAVKIVRPTTRPDLPRPSSNKKEFAGPRICRNIMIYGSCKFEDKGCIYYHPAPDDPDPEPAAETLPTRISLEAVKAPVFVPKITSPRIAAAEPAASAANAREESPEQPDAQTQAAPDEYPPEQSPPPQLSSFPSNPYESAHSLSSLQSNPYESAHSLSSLQSNPYDPPMSYESSDLQSYQSMALDPYYDAPRQPINYHLYTAPPPTALAATHLLPASPALRASLHARSELIYAPAHPAQPGLELAGYHTVAPLEPGAQSRTYRAVKSADGAVYVLRRVENYRVMQHAALAPIEAWSKIRHPAIVSVREGFTTRAFNDSSLVIAYDFHPGARPLSEAYPTGGVPERTLWSVLVQLAGAVRAAHDAGLALRVLDASKVLLTGENRVRAGSAGVLDVLEPGADAAFLMQEDLAALGRLMLQLCGGPSTAPNANANANPASPNNNGGMFNGMGMMGAGGSFNGGMTAAGSFNGGMGSSGSFSGAMGSSGSFNGGAFGAMYNGASAGYNGMGAGGGKALEMVGRAYSPDVKTVIMYLTGKPGPHKTVGHLFDMIGSRVQAEMNETFAAVDRMEAELMSELENARLVRLLCKFGFINERPEFGHEPRWSDTGDRYILKLFRDYVFHQVDERGRAAVNLAHVLTCLNKLDVGAEERIMLVSRDEQSCLVVSYRDVKTCMENAFGELVGR